MAIQKQIWQNYIMEHLFDNNEFLKYADDATLFVQNGCTVHIPQAALPSGAEVNRTTLPATITQQVDTDVTYDLDWISTNPRRILNAEQYDLSYDKRALIMRGDMASLQDKVAKVMIYNWLKNGVNIIRTTGGSVAAHLPSATGNRKLFVANDLKRARLTLNKLNMPKERRYALIDADMFDQLTSDATFNSTRDAIKDMNLPEGTIGYLYGFYLIEKGSVCRYTNDSTPVVKAINAAAAADDNGIVMCWQMDEVEKAIGEIKVNETIGDASNYGDIYSFECRAGGRAKRATNPGVVSIVQAVYTP